MPRAAHLPLLVWAVLGFATWRSSAILHAWRHSPLDRFGWIAFALWALPAALHLVRQGPPDEAQPGRRILLAASLSATLGGTVGDLNAAQYLGLALAIVAIPGGSWRNTLWLVTALSWMPALSWIAMGLPRPVLIAGRILIAAAGTALALWVIPRDGRHPRLPPPGSEDTDPNAESPLIGLEKAQGTNGSYR